MINRTYRTLNEKPRLLGFTGWQWLTLLLTVVVAFGLVKLVGLDARPALTLMAFTLSFVIAVALAQEPGAISPLGYVADHVRFFSSARRYVAGERRDSKRPTGLLVLAEEEDR